MKKLFKKVIIFWPVFVCVAAYIFIFRKVFFQGLVPFPGDLLVSWASPYRNGFWDGYSSWTTHKEFILADVIRQLFPWRMLAMDIFKQGQIPLWNIYAFSGIPLMANVQSAVFYPLNILMLIQPQMGWIVYIMVQPVLAMYFMFRFIRSLELSKVSATLAALGFAFFGYVTVWFEMGTIGHAALWLPLILWGVTEYIRTKKKIYVGCAAAGIGMSILAGHPQTSMYILLFTAAYYLLISWKKTDIHTFWKGGVILALGIAISGLQLIPGIELMLYSAREANVLTIFERYTMPWSHIAMLFAPDYFGNPATGNFWGADYGEFMSYSGIVVLVFAFIGFYYHFQKPFIKLLAGIVVFGFLSSMPTNISTVLYYSHFPVLSSSLPSRILFLVGVCIIIAAAYGVESVVKEKKKMFLPPLALLGGIYAVLWATVLLQVMGPENAAITKRNLILPTGLYGLTSILIVLRTFITGKYIKARYVMWVVIFALAAFDYSYFLNKYLPISDRHFMYPEHPYTKKLSELSQVDRTFGYGGGNMEKNLFVQWRILSPEGYDSLYPKRYSEFMRAGAVGKYDPDIARTDALIPESEAKLDSYGKQVLLNLMGVKYFAYQGDEIGEDWMPETWVFPPSRFGMIYQWKTWQIYKNKQVMPRAVVFHNYTIKNSTKDTLDTLFSKKFDYKNTVILDTTPSFKAASAEATPAKITKYSSNTVEIQTNTKKPGILFLADNNFPGWKATIDGKQSDILYADHTFRGVEIPKGEHSVTFTYAPTSFYIGVAISLVSIVLVVLFVLFL